MLSAFTIVEPRKTQLLLGTSVVSDHIANVDSVVVVQQSRC